MSRIFLDDLSYWRLFKEKRGDLHSTQIEFQLLHILDPEKPITSTLIVRESIRYQDAPPEMVPAGEKPTKLFRISYQCEAIGYGLTIHVGVINTFDIQVHRKTVLCDILPGRGDCSFEFVNN